MTSTEILPYEQQNGQRDWVDLMPHAITLAEHVVSTGFVPPGLRGKPDSILAAIMYGHEIGMGPMRSLAMIAMIDGKPSVAAEADRALILSRGHELWVDEATTTRVTMVGRRRGSSQTQSVTWTMDDAKRAGLAGKDNWRRYPRQMLTARATTDLARLMFADVIAGLGTHEEIEGEIVQLDEPPEPPKPTSTRSRTRKRGDGEAPPTGSQVSTSAPPAPGAADQPPKLPGELTDAERAAEQASRLDPADQVAALAAAHASGAASATAAAGNSPSPAVAAAPDEYELAEHEHEHRLLEQALAAAGAVEVMTDKQRRKMQALFRERGVTSREPRLAYCAHVAMRPIETSSELTIEEAGRVIDALEQWDPADPDSKPFPDYDPDTAPWPEGF